ncbi:uncharacterized protein LOC133182425 [Saccostrea echinata]|uniref:uncharacterized protein LOC133182425 n=1 Tax=Saccostrea echinata TaxID=191078 RepID=UPI002A802860|nr:uncharacterized protein LOC133182425 [Saccostrea echinata]
MSTRCCAFNFCTNNATKITKWKRQTCEIHHIQYGLGSCICEPPFRLFPFPTELKDNYSRQKWTSIVNRKNGSENWKPKEDSRVCSEHFLDGRPTPANPYPTLKLGYTPHKPIISRPPPKERSTTVFQTNQGKRRRLELTDLSIPQNPTSDPCEMEQSLCRGTDGEVNISPNDNYDKKIAHLEAKIKELEIKLDSKSKEKSSVPLKRFSLSTVMKSDVKVKFYTGLPNLASFNAVFQTILPNLHKVRYWKGPKRLCNPLKQKNKFSCHLRTLSPKEEMILCLMKLRLGYLNEDIADRFGVSSTHVSSVFTTWIKLLSSVLGTLVFNPPREVVISNLPPSFQNNTYRNVRHIIDCTEIFIETPNNLQVAAQTWSDYKHHHTAKILVSITPAGMINFVSEAWTGRASDKLVTLNSGFLNIIEPYDKVMADRGFPIREELTLLRAELLIPPGRRGVSQMSASDVSKTKAIANRRIHVEQAIRRMKQFHIIKNEMPITLLHHIDDTVKVIAGICNLYPPLPRY